MYLLPGFPLQCLGPGGKCLLVATNRMQMFVYTIINTHHLYAYIVTYLAVLKAEKLTGCEAFSLQQK